MLLLGVAALLLVRTRGRTTLNPVTACPLGSELVSQPGASAVCVPCSSDEFQPAADQPCQNKTICTPSQFEAAPGSLTSDRTCQACSTCPEGTLLFAPCQNVTDTVCAVCGATCGAGFFASEMGTCDSMLCVPCPAGTYKALAGNDSSCTLCPTLTCSFNGTCGGAEDTRQCSFPNALGVSGSSPVSTTDLIIIVACVVCGTLTIVIFIIWCLAVRQRKRRRNEGSRLAMLGKTDEVLGTSDVATLLRSKTTAFITTAPPHQLAAVRPTVRDALIIPNSCVDTYDVIGEGHFALVYEGQVHGISALPDFTRVAIKSLRKDTQLASERTGFIREMNIICKVDHPHIVRAYGMTNEAMPRLVMELLPLGDLKRWLETQSAQGANISSIGLTLLVKMSAQIADGMKYLESRHIIHRDLAARNIMLTNTLNAKIADLGLSREVVEKSYYRLVSAHLLPFRWMAPESLNYGLTSHASDTWAFGITMWEIFTLGDKPYAQLNNTDIPDHLNKGFRLPRPPLCPSVVYDVMYLCWSLDAKDRPTFSVLQPQLEEMFHIDLTIETKTPSLTMSSLPSDTLYMSPRGDKRTSKQSMIEGLPDSSEISRASLVSWLQMGSGSFGEVYRAIYCQRPPVAVIVKGLRVGATHSETESFVTEAKRMLLFSHPNVLHLYGLVTETKPWLAILDITEYGDLRDLLLHAQQHHFQLTISERLAIIAQVAAGLAHIRSNGVVHRGIAAESCLVASNNTIKIAGFGLAVVLEADAVYLGEEVDVAQLGWLAIESLEQGIYSAATDVWGFGVVMWEVFSNGAIPWEGTTFKQLTQLLQGSGRLRKPEIMGNEIHSIMSSCWAADPASRPTASSLASRLTMMLSESVLASPMTRDLGLRITSLKGLTEVEEAEQAQPQPVNIPVKWMRANCTRAKAEQLLAPFAREDGVFLVREKDAEMAVFAVSVTYHGVVTHHIIDLFAQPFAAFNAKPCYNCYTLEQVIDYLHKPHADWPVVLKRPCP